jgi:hypothetical protein
MQHKASLGLLARRNLAIACCQRARAGYGLVRHGLPRRLGVLAGSVLCRRVLAVCVLALRILALRVLALARLVGAGAIDEAARRVR